MAVINRGSNTRQHFINDIRMAVIVSDIVIVTMTFYTLVLIESTTAIEGFIAITFERYSNPTGGAANGQCCDGRAFLCENHGCDYVFKLCLDDEDSRNTRSGCRYGYKQSKEIRNQDDVIFDRYIGDLPNPVMFAISSWPSTFLVLKLDVYDKDQPFTSDDYVDYLQITIDLKIGSRSFVVYGTRPTDKTSLTGNIEVICTEHCEGFVDYNPRTTSESPVYHDGVVFIDWPNADCDNLAQHGYRHRSGVYSLRVAHLEKFRVYCEMSGLRGWTVIQRRIGGQINFFRSKKEYVNGFGDLETEFWLGLQKIYLLTNQRRYKLRVSLQKADGSFVYSEYESFGINQDYVLHVSGYNGTAGDALNYRGFGRKRLHNGMSFTTYDDDNDRWSDDNCGRVYQSGWWFNDCYWANLNGIYLPVNNTWPRCHQGRCIAWRTIKGYQDYSLIKTEMKILPVET